jgi:hypothetical protein
MGIGKRGQISIKKGSIYQTRGFFLFITLSTEENLGRPIIDTSFDSSWVQQCDSDGRAFSTNVGPNLIKTLSGL